MSDEIDIETFNHLVELAALELEPAEAEYLRKQLNNQLKAIHELEAIPLSEVVGVTSHGVPYTETTRPPLRADQLSVYPDPAALLAQAPQFEDGYIIVPEIPHTTLK